MTHGITALIAGVALTAASAAPAAAQSSRLGTPDDPTVKSMIAVERMWANSACGFQPNLKDSIADDFQGIGHDGRPYGKKEALMFGRDKSCQLGAVKIRFFGDTVAVAYGDESSVGQIRGRDTGKRCTAWTDTWLKRSGKWQIIAAQETIVDCKK